MPSGVSLKDAFADKSMTACLKLARSMPTGTYLATGVPPSGFELSLRQSCIATHDYKPQKGKEQMQLGQTKRH